MTKKVITVSELYNLMYDQIDPNGWWAGRSNWEIIWGTVLIQNTNWNNAAKALKNLYLKTAFLPQKILSLSKLDLVLSLEKSSSHLKALAQRHQMSFYYMVLVNVAL